MKKYELTTETKNFCGITLYRIKALRSIRGIKPGELGGWVESESNLSQLGDAWVSGNAQVYGGARVYGNAWVHDGAWVSGDACIYGGARVYGDARVYGGAQVYGNAQVCGNAQVYGNAQVSGNAQVCNNEHIMWISHIGSRNGTTTFFATTAGIYVSCGCFSGSIAAFEDAVKNKHGENGHGKAYLLAIELAKLKIKLPEEV